MTETVGARAPVLRAREVTVSRDSSKPPAELVRGVSVDVRAGEVIGVLGESGSGKTTLCRAIAGSLPRGLSVSGGSIEIAPVEPGPDAAAQRRASMILQQPLTALHPMLRIGDQVSEAAVAAGVAHGRSARAEALAVLERVGLRDAAAQMDRYPHQLSGGQRQRALVGMMLACRPQVLIADEPTSALDVTTQARLLDLLAGLVADEGIALMIVTHDFGVAAKISDQLLVMYGGRVIEQGSTTRVLRAPRHPYTAALMRALPTLDGDLDRLEEIPGFPPSPGHLPPGCSFAPRCRFARDRCHEVDPALAPFAPGHLTACLRASEIWGKSG